MFLQLVSLVVHTLYVRSSKGAKFKVSHHWQVFWTARYEADPFHILWGKKKHGKRMEIFIYDLSNLTMPFLFCCCLSVTLPEKKQMMVRRKKRKKRVDIFHRSVWPLWHNVLEKRHTWIVYLEDWVSWFSKCRHCRAVWDKTPSHFTAAVTVFCRQLCRAGLIPYTFFLYLLPAQEPAQIAMVLIPANSCGK